MMRTPKILGADVELGNFVDGPRTPEDGSGRVAARLLLQEIDGIPASATPGAYSSGCQDWGRRFLPGNGGCAYIDLDHLELALPETLSAFDHVRYWRAMLQVARTALDRANARLPDGYRLRAMANCSDGHDNSYGAHVSILVTRPTWDSLIRRRPHYLAYLASFQVSSIVFTGAGKVGAENGRPWTDFQLSQRADFFETLLGEQTTYNRPLVNARDEALCGPRFGPRDVDALARLHVIFFDATLCQVATLLRAGTLQIVTAMLEAGRVSTRLALDDPLDALDRWSRDPSLSACARLADGNATTAVELQMRFLEDAARFNTAGGFDGVVPHAAEILDLWKDTLVKLKARDFPALSRRIDWVLKHHALERAMATRPALTWSSPEMRHLDQVFASIDEDGLFWAYEDAGLVDCAVSHADIARAVGEPPDDTRAWTRAQILRRAGERRIEDVDWDRIAVRTSDPRSTHGWWERRTVPLACPFGATRADNEALFADARTLDDAVASLATDGPSAFDAPPRVTRYLH
jgi:proteasome accessory factor A